MLSCVHDAFSPSGRHYRCVGGNRPSHGASPRARRGGGGRFGPPHRSAARTGPRHRSGGGRAFAVVADVTREEDMLRLVRQTVERFGRLDVMICNAGFGIDGSLNQIAGEHMRQTARRQLSRHLLRRARGAAGVPATGHRAPDIRLVHRRKRGVPQMGAYAATKFAQVGLAECLRAELVRLRHPRQRGAPGIDGHGVPPGHAGNVRRGVARARASSDRRAGGRCYRARHRAPRARDLSLSKSARAGAAERDRARVLRPLRQAIRPASR